MLTIKDIKNFVKKFPEIELHHNKDYYGDTYHYAVMKEQKNYVVFEFNNTGINKDEPYIFLNQSIPMRLDSDECKFQLSSGDVPYGNGFTDLKKMEKPLRKLIFMLDQLILAQKKMKMYEKKLNMENDFKENKNAT